MRWQCGSLRANRLRAGLSDRQIALSDKEGAQGFRKILEVHDLSFRATIVRGHGNRHATGFPKEAVMLIALQHRGPRGLEPACPCRIGDIGGACAVSVAAIGQAERCQPRHFGSENAPQRRIAALINHLAVLDREQDRRTRTAGIAAEGRCERPVLELQINPAVAGQIPEPARELAS